MSFRPGLYIHIPFCVAKCGYCDFFSRPCSSVQDSYVDSVLSQCTFLTERYGVSSWSTVYVGGGTPSLLSPMQLERLVSGVMESTGGERPVEFTVEVNPETLDRERLSVLEGTGVTRLSLGIQSLNQKALDAVGRHCSREKALDALNLVRSNWSGRLNLDAIAGLPLQDCEAFVRSLEEILSYEPDHLSLYSLMVEEGTPLERKISNGLPWDEDEADSQWILGRSLLEEKGYHQYEVSNFARPGEESIHNLSYWRQKDYLACGAGGCGTVYDFQQGKAFRYTNTDDIEKYVRYWNGSHHGLSMEDWPCDHELLDLDIMEYEYLMMGLRTLEGVNDREYRNRFSSLSPWHGDLENRLGKKDGLWGRLMGSGHALCRRNMDGSMNMALTAEGLLFLNTYLLEL